MYFPFLRRTDISAGVESEVSVDFYLDLNLYLLRGGHFRTSAGRPPDALSK